MSNPWSEIEKPPADVNTLLAHKNHPLHLYWGVDSKGQYLFVIDVAESSQPDKKELPDLEGIKTWKTVYNKRCRLVLLLNEVKNWELFCALCEDLMRASQTFEEERAAIAVVVRRLRRWQEFLKNHHDRILTLEEIKGLLGELIFLEGSVASKFGWDDAISFWKGPEGAPQDFAIHTTAVEVKCQSGSSKAVVKISSVDQLDPQLPVGYLVVHTLATADERSDEFFTLNSKVAEIRRMLDSSSDATRERFENLLFLAKYYVHERYDDYVFQRVSTRSFLLADGFPRLVHDNVAVGIQNVRYDLELDACAPFEAKLILPEP